MNIVLCLCYCGQLLISFSQFPSALLHIGPCVRLTYVENAFFAFSLAGPGVAGYLTAGTSSSAMSNLPPPVDHEAGDLGYQT